MKKPHTFEKFLPSEDLDVCQENLEEFFYVVKERQDIWFKRFSKEPKPWTKDQILLNNKFTNVYRELDRESQFLISKIMIPFDTKNLKGSVITYANDDIKLLYYYMFFFKFFNNNLLFSWLIKNSPYRGIPTPEEYDPIVFEELLKEFRMSGGNPFTNAYCTNSVGSIGHTRDWHFCNKVIPKMISLLSKIETLAKGNDVKPLIKCFETISSVSHFVSHELYQDLTYITIYCKNFKFKFDQNDFTNVGPGCKVGLRLIFPSLQEKEIIGGIGLLRDMFNEQVEDFKYTTWNKVKKVYEVSETGELTLHNIEMMLCEYQKYWKMKVGVGKQRSKINVGERDNSFLLY